MGVLDEETCQVLPSMVSEHGYVGKFTVASTPPPPTTTSLSFHFWSAHMTPFSPDAQAVYVVRSGGARCFNHTKVLPGQITVSVCVSACVSVCVEVQVVL